MRNFLALAFLFAFPMIVRAQDAKPIGKCEYFPVAVGTTWKYTTGTGTVTTTIKKHEVVDGKTCAVMESNSGGMKSEEHVFVGEDGLYRLKMAGQPISPPWKFLSLPVKKGESWEGESKVAGATLKGKSTIDMAEVKVPKGKFESVKCSGNITAAGQEIATTVYLAKGIGMVKQEVKIAGQDVVLELVEFTEGKESKE